ncbi:hypothetical protein [Mycolicibacterium sediminis]|uniref:Lipoprotein LpqN n=1 Tax=Mycolicibacterium sediminis TaxID=1286180 RepID=A0A7I7QJL9_9MYCO|nr:hypothetical protein [Mycolicibacterium sediminis]BBY26559.1 hypothetical protein MSEDJ_06550 [Mycolicibacterium sediminis]
MTSVVRAAATLAAVLVLAACGSPDGPASGSEAAAGGADASQCATVDVPMLDIPTKADGDPVMAIPAPAGWERKTEMDSEIIRFVLVNPSLAAENFAPNVVVTLESIAGDASADEVFEQQRSTLVSQGGATDLKTTTGTLCGQPAETIDYVGAPVGATPSRPITLLLSALQAGERTFAVAVTVQTLRPDDPTYVRDRDTILEGFRFLPPDSA